MRRFAITISVVVILIFIFGYNGRYASGISGRIVPTDAVDIIYALSGKDSLKTIPANGAFMLDTKPGLYKVIIDAKQPFKDVMLESVEVTEGKTTDLGEIKIIE